MIKHNVIENSIIKGISRYMAYYVILKWCYYVIEVHDANHDVIS